MSSMMRKPGAVPKAVMELRPYDQVATCANKLTTAT